MDGYGNRVRERHREREKVRYVKTESEKGIKGGRYDERDRYKVGKTRQNVEKGGQTRTFSLTTSPVTPGSSIEALRGKSIK